jgi:hypothetical protein
MTLFVSFTKNTFLGILLRVVISIPPAKGERRARRGGMNDKLHISRFDNLSSFYVRGKKKLHLKRIGRSKNQIGESRPTNISPSMVLQKKNNISTSPMAANWWWPSLSFSCPAAKAGRSGFTFHTRTPPDIKQHQQHWISIKPNTSLLLPYVTDSSISSPPLNFSPSSERDNRGRGRGERVIAAAPMMPSFFCSLEPPVVLFPFVWGEGRNFVFSDEVDDDADC